MNKETIKPLGKRAYGSIGHLPQSRMGPGDHSVHEGQAKICCERARDRHDRIIVQEKLDGSCVAVAKLDGKLVPLGRAGWPAITSPHEQHRLFDRWVWENESRFREVLLEGERLCGEWLAQAHGTRYDLAHDPFVAFDVMCGDVRKTHDEFMEQVSPYFETPFRVSVGPPMSVPAAMEIVQSQNYHGATDAIEGVVYRVERKGRVDFLAKYVRPEKIDGCYLPELTGIGAVWNWRPTAAYLAEHLPDSEFAIDEPWLRSVGFLVYPCNDPVEIGYMRAKNGLTIAIKRRSGVNVNGYDVPCTTRGDFRRLASALNIHLKEPTP